MLREFPEHGKLTLAKALVAKYPMLFDTVEIARSVLRNMTGTHGPKSRLTKKLDHSPDNPMRLPKSYAADRTPFVLPDNANRILVISDLHIPYHSIDAITAALEYGKSHNANTVLINGDLIDFHHQSTFEHDATKRSTKQEFDAAREFLEILRREFPKAGIYFTEGNHDSRYEKWLMRKAPELFGDAHYTLQTRLGLDDLQIRWIDANTLVYAGKLSISHGHKIVRGVFAPVNAARGVFLKTKASHLIGHTHSVSEHTEKRLNGDIVTTWSTGCLCELTPEYDPFVNKYTHGFAFITTEPNGDFHVDNKRIYNGKII